jgi:hypothetical protein
MFSPLVRNTPPPYPLRSVLRVEELEHRRLLATLQFLSPPKEPHFNTDTLPKEAQVRYETDNRRAGDGGRELVGTISASSEFGVIHCNTTNTGRFSLDGPPVDMRSFPEDDEQEGDPITVEAQFDLAYMLAGFVSPLWTEGVVRGRIQSEVRFGALSKERLLVDQQDLGWKGGTAIDLSPSSSLEISSFIGDILELNFHQFDGTINAKGHDLFETYNQTASVSISYAISISPGSSPQVSGAQRVQTQASTQQLAVDAIMGDEDTLVGLLSKGERVREHLAMMHYNNNEFGIERISVDPVEYKAFAPRKVAQSELSIASQLRHHTVLVTQPFPNSIVETWE